MRDAFTPFFIAIPSDQEGDIDFGAEGWDTFDTAAEALAELRRGYREYGGAGIVFEVRPLTFLRRGSPRVTPVKLKAAGGGDA
jgi:hypothetical protein